MFGRKMTGFVLSFVFLVSLACGVILLASPEPSMASIITAGIKEGDVCSCPVMVGNCACKLKT